MVIDMQRSVLLGVREKRALIAVPTPKPPPGTAFPPRRLMLRGVPVFELGLWCGTCPALFNKLNEPEVADLSVANERLNVGLDAIDAEILRAFGRVLPKSDYTALLLDLSPQLVTPGSTSDYFSHEQVATWGVDPVVGSPENPATPYYRTFETPLGQEQHLYEFVVPMVPPAWNDQQRVDEYSDNPGTTPATAVAYSLLDVIQPAMDEGDDYYEHWVLSHFLLDGHHKVYAAATAGRPIRLLSFLDEHISIASQNELSTLVQARSKKRQARSRP
ncbi:hypothetical protein KUV85_06135 [Nocardioides panacisoli]|uniref:hypothetical protein n=1 Tax=Nocardioides panacisoli TaxID=627624 RepID=UPI001C6322DF|nr:hypothetical protein [Nocardioides panacisoli]QYJ05251.1 hypothetical protein KUV85_06135 [Nocardioides panacisoli]